MTSLCQWTWEIKSLLSGCGAVHSCENYWNLPLNHLTRWGWDKMAVISETTYSNAFSQMKKYEFWLKFHWSLLLRVQLTISEHWFRISEDYLAPNRQQDIILVYWHKHASLGLNELNPKLPGSFVKELRPGKMATRWLTTFSFERKCLPFDSNSHKLMFPVVKLTISQHCFR